ncbi:hypothetical protein K1T71_012896 [Dendrolimus kikuchii]|uniref:Uncharacterized protein n=1 Tax=Dendrolimus kikuchii TaxID=765133 RepID=A0ACC1CIF1_9NEOP|nr:hypothetical protein K1T71_012896 [Dendrolimus kikuchii]
MGTSRRSTGLRTREAKMKTILILTFTVAVVNCGLLKELVQPVTDSVHKGELFNQKEQKEDAEESKGVLDKLVNNLDVGAEKLISTLTGEFKPEGLDGLNKNANATKDDTKKTDEKPEVSKVDKVNGTEKADEKKEPEVKDLDTKVSTTPPTVDKEKEVKVDEVTTPKVNEVKPEESTKKVEEVKIEEKEA